MSDTTGRRPALPPYWEAYIQQTKARHRQVEDVLSARIEELEAKADHAWSMVAKGDADVIRAAAHAATLEAKLAKAGGALEFYNEVLTAFSSATDATADETLDRDGGKLARATLAEIRGETP